jgi:hypothetical protein
VGFGTTLAGPLSILFVRDILEYKAASQQNLVASQNLKPEASSLRQKKRGL